MKIDHISIQQKRNKIATTYLCCH